MACNLRVESDTCQRACSPRYAEFVPIDETEQPTENPHLPGVVKFLAEKKVTFEILCDGDSMHAGKLILFGSSAKRSVEDPQFGYVLLGVFVPRG